MGPNGDFRGEKGMKKELQQQKTQSGSRAKMQARARF